MASNAKDSAALTVRPKASHRKHRASELQRTALEPVQERSRRRNDQILEAAAKLLETVNIENLAHADIATVAGISKASVHYHYPTIAAIQLALGQRYDADVAQYVTAHAAPGHVASWHEIVRRNAGLAWTWFNQNRPACEALLGPLMTRENRLAGMDYNARGGSATLRRIRKEFVIAEQPQLEEVFAYNGEIIDLFWSRSYLRSGRIDEAALEESLRASLGYLRNFLPEILPRQPG